MPSIKSTRFFHTSTITLPCMLTLHWDDFTGIQKITSNSQVGKSDFRAGFRGLSPFYIACVKTSTSQKAALLIFSNFIVSFLRLIVPTIQLHYFQTVSQNLDLISKWLDSISFSINSTDKYFSLIHHVFLKVNKPFCLFFPRTFFTISFFCYGSTGLFNSLCFFW